jgi:Sec-independent protein translocase protein TatA
MNILGVGPFEIILVLLVILLVLGPKELVNTSKKLGQFLNNVRRSEAWSGVTQLNRTVRDLPATLMREAELEDMQTEMVETGKPIKDLSGELQLSNSNEIVSNKEASIEPVFNKTGPVSSEKSAETSN